MSLLNILVAVPHTFCYAVPEFSSFSSVCVGKVCRVVICTSGLVSVSVSEISFHLLQKISSPSGVVYLLVKLCTTEVAVMIFICTSNGYAGIASKILNFFFRTPNVLSITFLKDEWRRLKSSL